MRIKPLTSRDMLGPKLVTSPPRKKFITIFGSPINDSEEDEKQTCSNEIGGRGGEELDATTTQDNTEEELEPNLDKVINNIQDEFVVSVELIVFIT
jgi:hypothetical protein